MYSCRRMLKVWPRTMRAMVSHPTAPIAMNRRIRLRPKMTVRKMTKKISGKPLKISMMRIMRSIGAAADVARDRAKSEAEHQAHDSGHEADRHRHARPCERAHEQVAPQPVGAEPMGVRECRIGGHVRPVERLDDRWD